MMASDRQDVTLSTLHEVRTGFADLKTTLVAGFRALPTRVEWQ